VSDLAPPYGARDRGDMAGRIAAAPDQIERCLALCDETPWRPGIQEPDLLAIGGMGGSAIGADLVRDLYADRLPRPVLTVREVRWPACVTARSLALVSSYSGDTREALALYQRAAERGIPRLGLTTGGTLLEWCERDRVPCLRVPDLGPPRAALYQSWVALTRLLSNLGWVEDPVPSWRAAARRMRERNHVLGPESPEPANRAKQIARELEGRFVFIYAGSERLTAVTTRVRNQLNENAKLLGHSAGVPELDHNEIVGWERDATVSDRSGVLILRDAEDEREITEGLTLTAEFARRRGAKVVEVTEMEGDRLSRMAALVQFGDYLSLYSALLAGADPTPIESIAEFKRRMKESEAPRG
jgi:glucose/mannose-6-phosphate isomerase